MQVLPASRSALPHLDSAPPHRERSRLISPCSTKVSRPQRKSPSTHVSCLLTSLSLDASLLPTDCISCPVLSSLTVTFPLSRHSRLSPTVLSLCSSSCFARYRKITCQGQAPAKNNMTKHLENKEFKNTISRVPNMFTVLWWEVGLKLSQICSSGTHPCSRKSRNCVPQRNSCSWASCVWARSWLTKAPCISHRFAR